jgi:hypothetical protein
MNCSEQIRQCQDACTKARNRTRQYLRDHNCPRHNVDDATWAALTGTPEWRELRRIERRCSEARRLALVAAVRPPATDATANFDASARRGSVNYMVDHICEPILSTPFASSELRRPPQDGGKTPLTIWHPIHYLHLKRRPQSCQPPAGSNIYNVKASTTHG